ncbi:MAG TPA: flagellar export chaperone FliS [Pirellulales bacterium]|jgi:flagellar protein FliS|nr:flagellar export chaperone FliS [Pirellulales bacterium]
MAPRAGETYLAGEVLAAPPQKLQLMLIEAALRMVRLAEQHWAADDQRAGNNALRRCQQIVVELLSGLRRETMPDLVGRVASVYMFMYRSLVAATQDHDPRKLADVARVLEMERETWRQVCQALAQSSEPVEAHERLTLEA